jgi:hypothetical protein
MKTMKKISVCIVMASLIITGRANAQQHHMNLGIKAGVNVYTIHNDNNVDYDSKVGFHAGLLSHIHMSKHVAIQPEVVYSSQGAEYTVVNTETKIKLGYINVPVMVQYMFDNGFRLQAGPQVGFLVNAESETNNISTDISNNLNDVDFDLGVGVGYVHPASGIGVDARYNFGIANINDNGNVKSVNNGFQLGLFYLFHHK